MGFKPGHKKIGGRQKGTPNRQTRTIEEKCAAAGIDPFEVLIQLCKDPDKGFQMHAAKELCQYLAPKRKAIETTQIPVDDMGEDLGPTDEAKLLELVRVGNK